MFLIIGLPGTPSPLAPNLMPALTIAAVLIFLARPVGSWFSLTLFKFNSRKKSFLSWVGLRGAVPIFLAIIPPLSSLDNGRLYFNTAFVVVVVSLLVQGWTSASVTRWLKLETTAS